MLEILKFSRSNRGTKCKFEMLDLKLSNYLIFFINSCIFKKNLAIEENRKAANGLMTNMLYAKPTTDRKFL